MRWFFSLLLLANLTVAGWLFWQERESQPDTERTNVPAQGSLQLLSELAPQSLKSLPHAVTSGEAHLSTQSVTPAEATAPSEPAAIVETPPSMQMVECLRISPIAKVADVEVLARKLSRADLTVLDSGEDFTDRHTYWVLIMPYKTVKAAREAAAELAKAKVRDFLVVRSGEFENGISLGLFSQKEGAEQRLREINALKLNIRTPEIQLRISSVRSHWLMVRVQGENAPEALQRQLAAEGLQSSRVECPL